MNSILIDAKNLLYDLCGFELSNIEIEKESAEYAAHRFEINNLKILFRQAKITPTKVGQFVTLWKRTKEKDPITGEIIPGKVKPEFKMYANISSILPGGYNWLNTWTNDAVANTSDSMLNLDCGLVRQEVDLSLMTDVYSATTTINDKITKTTLSQLAP